MSLDDDNSREFSVALSPMHLLPAKARYTPLKFTPEIVSSSALLERLANSKRAVVVEPRPAFYFTEYHGQNFAHVLMDVLLPIYQGLHTFGLMYVDDDQPSKCFREVIGLEQLTNGSGMMYSCQWMNSTHWRHGTGVPACERFRRTVWPLLVKQRVALQPSGNTPTLYRHLVSGSGDLTDHCHSGHAGFYSSDAPVDSKCNQGRERLLMDYVNALVRCAGVPAQPNLGAMKVVVWDKGGSGSNTGVKIYVDQLQNFSKGPLAETVQRLGLVWVSGVEVYGDTGPNGLADMSLREQMALYRNAAVSLGSVGGGSFGTLFMPRGSTAVRLSSPMVEPTVDWQLFSFMPMTQVKYVKARDPAIRPGSDDANALIADVVTGLRRFAVFHELQVPAFMQQPPD
jgi:hypothetical protein